MKKVTLLKSITLASCCILGAFSADAQFAFTNSNTALNLTATHSGCAVTVVDVNNDGLDDILAMDQSTTLVVYMQNQNGSFTRTSLGNISGTARVWGMAAADVDHNGWKDVVTGTNGTLYLVKLFWNGTAITSTTTTMTSSYFVQNITFGDFNNDGWVDVGVCDDVNYEKVYMNDGAGNLPILAKSTNSLTIGTGAQNLTVQTGLNFTAGQTVKVGFNGNNYMTGTVTSYTSGTGALVVNVTSVVGSGTFGSWSVHPTIVFNTNINPGLTVGGDPYDSGNYGSVWTDFDNDGDLDFYIAHCRQSASTNTDQRRRERLFVNDGNNNYTESAQTYGIEVTDFKQTWTTSFGDMDNDGDMDIVMTNHGENGQILQNDGTGHFTDITAGSGFNVTFDAIESVVEDFDNDGFLDIFVSGPGWVLYHNNGNGTYTSQTGTFAGTNLLSFATGDLNHDGKVDIFASYGNVYNTPTGTADVLYMNSTANSNHFITFNLEGVQSNKGAIGAKITIYGAFGKQIREVRSGETYGTSNTMALHFGLGNHQTIDSARIDWPSHSTPTRLSNLAADQFVTVVEGGCTITGNTIPGPYVLCTGQTMNLNAAAGYSSYLWSDATTAQSVTVSATGTYNVMVTDAAGCTNISPNVTVSLNPNETPTVSNSGSLTSSCAGTVTLTSSTASSYLWSGPSGFSATTQTINPTISGNYDVTIVGTCGNFTSSPIAVSVLAAPAPTVTGASGVGPVSLNLTAASNGGTINWYDQATGGTLLGTGNTFTTPVLSATTTYYAEEDTTYPGANAHAGQAYHTGTSNYSVTTTNGAEIFNALSACTLQSVKVYTDSAGTREIQLLDASNTVINSLSVTLPADTTVITLNWAIPAGTGYQLTTNGTVNTANFGAVSPYLWRSGSGTAYPYTVNGLISITNSNQGNTRFYYFYDWIVQGAPTVCSSSRVPVVAQINTTGISALTANNDINVYPNPANDEINITFESSLSTAATVEITDIAGRLLSSRIVEKPVQGQNVKLDVSSISAGTYLISIKTDNRKLVQKLVITK